MVAGVFFSEAMFTFKLSKVTSSMFFWHEGFNFFLEVQAWCPALVHWILTWKTYPKPRGSYDVDDDFKKYVAAIYWVGRPRSLTKLGKIFISDSHKGFTIVLKAFHHHHHHHHHHQLPTTWTTAFWLLYNAFRHYPSLFSSCWWLIRCILLFIYVKGIKNKGSCLKQHILIKETPDVRIRWHPHFSSCLNMLPPSLREHVACS